MMQIVFVGLGAGAAAALLFASVASGSIAAIFLFYLAPLPILIAALGWSHWAGLIAAASATAVARRCCLGFFFDRGAGDRLRALVARLSRAAGAPGSRTAAAPALEWYPVGRLVLWAAIIGTLIVAAADAQFRHGPGKPAGRTAQDATSASCATRRWHRTMLVIAGAAVPAAAVFSTLTNVFNLWLAAPIVKVSGAAARGPGRILSALTLPAFAAGLARGRDRRLVPAGPRSAFSRACLRRACSWPTRSSALPSCMRSRAGMASRGVRARGHLCGRHRVRLADPRACRSWAWPTPSSTFAAASRRKRGPPTAANLTDIRSTHNGDTTMEVILLERVAKLGQMGEVVRVKDGFARNFLLPKGKALRATKENRSRFETMKVELEARNLEQKSEAEKIAEKLDGQSFTVLRQAAEGGQLYGSVSPRDHRRTGHREEALRSIAPDRAQYPDQGDRTAQGPGLAASRSRGDDQRRGRAQCRRGRTAGPWRGHHACVREEPTRRRRSRGGRSLLRARGGRSAPCARRSAQDGRRDREGRLIIKRKRSYPRSTIRLRTELFLERVEQRRIRGGRLDRCR